MSEEGGGGPPAWFVLEQQQQLRDGQGWQAATLGLDSYGRKMIVSYSCCVVEVAAGTPAVGCVGGRNSSSRGGWGWGEACSTGLFCVAAAAAAAIRWELCAQLHRLQRWGWLSMGQRQQLLCCRGGCNDPAGGVHCCSNSCYRCNGALLQKLWGGPGREVEGCNNGAGVSPLVFVEVASMVRHKVKADRLQP